jgi:hypothetical protein
MRFFYFTFSLLFLASFGLRAQSLTGTNGLFKIPSAYIAPDGVSYVGASFLPKGYYQLYGTSDLYTGMPTFITLSLYDRIEFMFRYTHQLGQEVNPQTQYFPDRMFTLRYNVLKEASSYPAITIGLHDVSEALGGTSATPWFLATYIVGSKSFQFKGINASATLGYSHDIIDNSRDQVFNGLFSGFEFSSPVLPFFSFVGEYDSNHFNAAIKTTFFEHLHMSVGLIDMQALAGFVTYRFNLSNR